MNSKDLTIASAPVPYIGDLINHPLVEITESYLKSINVSPDSVRKCGDKEIVWSFCLKGVISVAYRLYKDENKEVFLHLECAFGIVLKDCEDLVASAFIRDHHSHHFPFWFAVNTDQLAVVMFRCYCSGITHSHYLLRLHTIITLGLHSNKTYVTKDFNVQPLPSAWFIKEAA